MRWDTADEAGAQFLPLCMAVTYFLLLPRPEAFASPLDSYAAVPLLDSDGEESEDDETIPTVESGLVAQALGSRAIPLKEAKAAHLTRREKLALARPLVVRYMMPLFFVYLAGTSFLHLARTILTPFSRRVHYKLGRRSRAALRDPRPSYGAVPRSNRQDAPRLLPVRPIAPPAQKNPSNPRPRRLWSLVYQTHVFLSRSSLSIFHLPPLPRSLLPLPTLVQLFLLFLTSYEASTGVLSTHFGENGAIVVVFFLISLEGLSGGLAYVNVFYRLGLDDEEGGVEEGKDKGRREREREFKIASVGFADTLGILLASGVASALEPQLCRMQVDRGRTFCKEL